LRLYKASKDEIYGDHSCYIALGYKRPELSVAAQYFGGVSGAGLEVGERRRRSTADVNPDFEFQMDDDTVLGPSLVAEAAAAARAQLTTALAAPADAEEINKAVANERRGAKTARISEAAAHAAAARVPPALAPAVRGPSNFLSGAAAGSRGTRDGPRDGPRGGLPEPQPHHESPNDFELATMLAGFRYNQGGSSRGGGDGLWAAGAFPNSSSRWTGASEARAAKTPRKTSVSVGSDAEVRATAARAEAQRPALAPSPPL
jgi:hypothetical protein